MSWVEIHYVIMFGLGILLAVGYGIYELARLMSRSSNLSRSDQRKALSASQQQAISKTKSDLLANASAKSLKLNMAAIDAINRMNTVVSSGKTKYFDKMSKY